MTVRYAPGNAALARKLAALGWSKVVAYCDQARLSDLPCRRCDGPCVGVPLEVMERMFTRWARMPYRPVEVREQRCVVCFETFTAGSAVKVCSQDCRDVWRRRRRNPHRSPCLVCGAVLARGRKKVCAGACAVEWRRLRMARYDVEVRRPKRLAA